MVNWYMKGQSDYISANFRMGFYIDHSGFAEGDYDTQDMETHGATSDPFMAFGIDTGPATWTYGQQQVEIGLLKSHRLKFDTTGSYKWVGPGQDDWAIIEAAGSAGNLGDLDDVVITGTPADNELLAWDTSTSKWINQTAAESGLSVSGHTHAQLHDRSHTYDSASDHSGTLSWAKVNKTGSNLTDLATRQHAGLTDITSDQHHAQSHNNTYHSTNYHTEVDGTGVVTVHSDMTSAGSGAIITVGERADLHAIYTLEQHDNAYHSTNYKIDFSENTAFNKDFGTVVTTVCQGNDGRLSDSRTPVNHANEAHNPDFCVNNDSRLSDARTPVSHNNTYHSETYITAVSEDSSPSLGGNLTLAGGYRIIGPGVSDYYIWSISSAYLTYGLYYNTGTPDYLEIKWAGATTFAVDMETGNITTVGTVDGVDVGDLKTAFDALSYYTQAEVNGLLHPQAHTLASHTTKAHSELSDAPADAHHVAFVQANADALYSVLAHLHDDRYMTDAEVAAAIAATYTNAEIDANTYTRAQVDTAVATKDTKEEAHAYVEDTPLTMTQDITFKATQLFDAQDVSALAADLANQATPAEAVQAVEDTGLVLTNDSGISFNAVMADQKYAGICIDIDTTGCNTYDLVYVDDVNSVQPADATDDTKMPAIGIVVEAGKVLTLGTVCDDDLIVCTTAGAVVYASTTLRKVTQTAPNAAGNMIQVIGICTGNHMMFVNVSLDMVEYV